MKEHPIAAGLWLILIVGGIGFLASAGLKKSAELEKKASRDQLAKEMEAVIDAGRRGEYDVVIQRIEALIPKHPDEIALYFNLGIAQRASNRLDDADRTFAKVLEMDPNDYDAMAERANIQKEKGNLDAAIDILEKIPPNEGRLNLRLRDDPLWSEVASNDRVQALRKKHGVDVKSDTSLHMQRMKEKGAPQGVVNP